MFLHDKLHAYPQRLVCIGPAAQQPLIFNTTLRNMISHSIHLFQSQALYSGCTLLKAVKPYIYTYRSNNMCKSSPPPQSYIFSYKIRPRLPTLTYREEYVSNQFLRSETCRAWSHWGEVFFTAAVTLTEFQSLFSLRY